MIWTKSIRLCCVLSLLLFGADKAKSPALERADQTYRSTITKAQSEFDRAKAKAMEVRQKAYRDALAAATRAGDFDTAAAIKLAISEFEVNGELVTKRSKPKDLVKFEEHEYAVIREPLSWHIAKRVCEEMGGHLATINSTREQEFLVKTCLAAKTECWLGATDEHEEGKWLWVDGSIADSTKFEVDNYNGSEHSIYCALDGVFRDMYSGKRYAYVCEWD